MIEVPVTNNGERDGAEVVHLFISDPVCSISRPIKELKRFKKEIIKKGETRVFEFELDPETDFCYLDENGDRILEAGDFYVSIAGKKVKVELMD